jgi:hypothetical protein
MDSTGSFSITERYDYQALLDEAIETVVSANAQLGSNEHTSHAALDALVEPLRLLKQAQAFFANTLTVQPLDAASLRARGVELAPVVRQWLQTHQFYLVQVPVTLKPAPGWAFTRLECGVVFSGGDPKVHALFPENVWTKILSGQSNLKLGLGTDFAFQAELEPVGNSLQALSGTAEAKIEATAGTGGMIAVGPFNVEIRRPEVLSTGREGDTIFWQLSGQAHVQFEEPYLAAVLRVPKQSEPIQAQGRLIAFHKFDFLGADFADWTSNFREKVRSFFSHGIPLEDVKTNWVVTR